MEYTVITGACGGLGQAFCRIYAKEKESLLITGRSQVKLEALQKQLMEEYQISVRIKVCNLSNLSETQQFCEELKSLSVKRLINNAGIGTYGLFEQETISTLLDIHQINMTSLMMLIHAVIPNMNKSGGEILNVASTAAFQPGPMMSVYYASKSYVLSLSEALWAELIHSNIKVSVLCCGPMNTEFASKAKLKHTWMQKLLMISVDDAALLAKKGLASGKRCIVPGTLNKMAVFVSKYLPDSLLVRLMAYVQSKRK
ncbi:MAG: SDR family oxidoreductase [Erysipelotrichaceae bacterium]|nr:SDR family oxidoreductase [Erysipelotrichaceae bacterium]